MTQLAFSIALPALAALAFDWIMMGRLAALAPSVLYRYIPTPWRYTALFFSVAWLLHAGEAKQPWYADSTVGIIATILYAAFSMTDVLMQRRRSPEDEAENRLDF